ncbi:MAG TPA: hypothetical protein VF600_01170 [Abditibacteriaceae bacterium]|jgi:hypothetical protein
MSWVWHKTRPANRRVNWDTPVTPQGSDRVEALYAWEERCRGYRLHPYPVSLEPPFVPYADFELEQAHHSSQALPDTTSGAGDRSFLTLRLPPEQKVKAEAVESWIRTLCSLHAPFSFEVVADENEIIFQLAASSHEVRSIQAQLPMHFPLGEFEFTEDTLRQKLQPFHDVPVGYQVVDFGLTNFAFQPLRRFTVFTADPLSGVIGALGQLAAGEVAGLQVLLVPARKPWAGSLLQIAQELGSDADGAQHNRSTRNRSYKGEGQSVWQARQKTGSPLFSCVIRVFAVSTVNDNGGGDAAAFSLCQRIGHALSVYNQADSNSLLALANEGYEGQEGYEDEAHFRDLLNRSSQRSGMLLSSEELVGLVHPPTETLVHPKLLRLTAPGEELPEHLLVGPGTVLGHHPYQGLVQPLFWPDTFRNRHCYLLGATRMGKSTLLLNMMLQDLQVGRGLCLIDPHGDLARDVLERVPPERREDVLYLDFSDREHPVAMGLLEAKDEWEKRLLTSDLLSILHRLFASSWGDRLEHILRHVLLTLLSQPPQNKHTLRDIRPLLSHKGYREEVLKNVTDPDLLAFWQGEFPGYSSSTFAPLYNKLGLLLSSPLVRNIVAQKESRLDLSEVMQGKKVLLVNLGAGLIGEDNAHFVGALLVSKLQISAMSSLRYGRQDRTPFTLYVDEFQHFVVSSFEKILSEAGKAGLSLVMANQFLEQLNSHLQSAILGNVGAMVSFRVSADSGRLLEKELAGRFTQEDLVSLGRGEAIARVGGARECAHIHTLPPPPEQSSSTAGQSVHDIVERTQATCCRSRAEIEHELEAERRQLEERFQAEAKTTAGPKTNAAIKAESKAGAKSKAESKDVEPNDEAQPDAGTEPEAEAEPKAEAESNSKARSKFKAKAKSKAKVKAPVDLKTRSKQNPPHSGINKTASNHAVMESDDEAQVQSSAQVQHESGAQTKPRSKAAVFKNILSRRGRSGKSKKTERIERRGSKATREENAARETSVEGIAAQPATASQATANQATAAPPSVSSSPSIGSPAHEESPRQSEERHPKREQHSTARPGARPDRTCLVMRAEAVWGSEIQRQTLSEKTNEGDEKKTQGSVVDVSNGNLFVEPFAEPQTFGLVEQLESLASVEPFQENGATGNVAEYKGALTETPAETAAQNPTKTYEELHD